jgi:hypothetical protein
MSIKAIIAAIGGFLMIIGALSMLPYFFSILGAVSNPSPQAVQKVAEEGTQMIVNQAIGGVIMEVVGAFLLIFGIKI